MNPIDLLPVVLSFAGTLVLTPVVRALARRRGVVARPKSDRWHKKPTALLGGGAIFTVVAAVDLALVPLTPQARVVLAPAPSCSWSGSSTTSSTSSPTRS